jgi:hypothetical protein
VGKKKTPARRQATRASSLGYPSPPLGQGGQGTPPGQGYGPPATGGYTLGLNTTSHNGSSYPQPNSANQPDTSSNAGPAPVPGPEAYRPSIAGNAPAASMDNPGVVTGDEPPDYPSVGGGD